MVDRTGSRINAGGSSKLGIIRYGREEMTQYELSAGDDIMPGEALMRTEDTDGPEFVHHDGTETKRVYIAVEARGRGMDAQTDTGYTAGEDLVIAVTASGGGLNLLVKDGESLANGDVLIPEADTGQFIEESGEGWSVAEAGEQLEVSGAATLVHTEVGN